MDGAARRATGTETRPHRSSHEERDRRRCPPTAPPCSIPRIPARGSPAARPERAAFMKAHFGTTRPGPSGQHPEHHPRSLGGHGFCSQKRTMLRTTPCPNRRGRRSALAGGSDAPWSRPPSMLDASPSFGSWPRKNVGLRKNCQLANHSTTLTSKQGPTDRQSSGWPSSSPFPFKT